MPLNSLDQDQAWQYARPDLNANSFDTYRYNFLKKVDFEKINNNKKSMNNLPGEAKHQAHAWFLV